VGNSETHGAGVGDSVPSFRIVPQDETRWHQPLTSRQCKQQNEKLRAARDLLLPRLMNGEIAV